MSITSEIKRKTNEYIIRKEKNISSERTIKIKYQQKNEKQNEYKHHKEKKNKMNITSAKKKLKNECNITKKGKEKKGI